MRVTAKGLSITAVPEQATDSGDHTNYTISNSSIYTNFLLVFVNGLFTRTGWSRSGTTITFTGALDPAAVVEVWYLRLI